MTNAGVRDIERILFSVLGGVHDGLNMPVAEGMDAVRLPTCVTDRETYIRSALIVGDASVTFYKHEDLTPEYVLDRLVKHYKVWEVNQPAGHH